MSGNTIIDDENIHEFINLYLTDKSSLPSDLRNKKIGRWDVSRVTDMSELFKGARYFDEPLDDWNTENVTNMSGMFYAARYFNKKLKFNTSKVRNMSEMFSSAYSFDQDLNFDTSEVTDMNLMFSRAESFKGILNFSNTSKVTNMTFMFADATSFNKPLTFDTSEVINMNGMFQNATSFNEDLHFSNTSKVRDMSFMFNDATSFNKDLSFDTSEVIHMTSMFENATSFNKPLSFNTTNVINMDYMFNNATSFNSDLINWDISNVRNMYEMFSGAASFNKPIDNWVISPYADTYNIFENCPIEEQNKPNIPMRIEEPQVEEIEEPHTNRIEVDSNQIHRETAKINFEHLNSFFQNKIYENVPKFISRMVNKLIDDILQNEEERRPLREGLQRIMTERLNELDYSQFNESQLKYIFNTLTYALQQSPEFQKIYIQNYINDCLHAYEGDDEDAMTCAAGALERFIFSLVPACQSLLTSESLDANKKEEYEKLIEIITANPNAIIGDFIKDWYQFHKTGSENAFPLGTTEEEKRQDLKRYLLEKFPDKIDLIEEKIKEIADNIGYEDDDFQYGGKKRFSRKVRKVRKTRKNRKTKKITKTKMSTTKKNYKLNFKNRKTTRKQYYNK